MQVRDCSLKVQGQLNIQSTKIQAVRTLAPVGCLVPKHESHLFNGVDDDIRKQVLAYISDEIAVSRVS